MALYGNPQVTGREKTFDAGDIIVSKTDLTGKITHGNRAFYRMAGLTEKSASSAKKGLAASCQAVVDLLAENKVGFNQFMFFPGV